MKVGQLVMLVGQDGLMPPLGSCGCIVGPLDEVGDHEVLFPRYLCPVPPGFTWEVPARMLIPLTPPPVEISAAIIAASRFPTGEELRRDLRAYSYRKT